MNNLINEIYDMVEGIENIEELAHIGEIGLKMINEAFCPYFGTGENERFGKVIIINNETYFKFHDNGEIESICTFNLKWPSRANLGEYLKENNLVLDK